MEKAAEDTVKGTLSCSSTRLGSVEYEESQCYQCPEGILGFKDQTAFILIDDPKISPFRWLQSLSTAELCFLIVESQLVKPEYQLKLAKEDLSIKIEKGDRSEVHVIASLGANPKDTTLNFRGPLVFNHSSKVFQQVIDEKGELKAKLLT